MASLKQPAVDDLCQQHQHVSSIPPATTPRLNPSPPNPHLERHVVGEAQRVAHSGEQPAVDDLRQQHQHDALVQRVAPPQLRGSRTVRGGRHSRNNDGGWLDGRAVGVGAERVVAAKGAPAARRGAGDVGDRALVRVLGREVWKGCEEVWARFGEVWVGKGRSYRRGPSGKGRGRRRRQPRARPSPGGSVGRVWKGCGEVWGKCGCGSTGTSMRDCRRVLACDKASTFVTLGLRCKLCPGPTCPPFASRGSKTLPELTF